MENDNNYKVYATSMVREVPKENLKYLIELFMDKASMNMGNEYNDKTLKGTIDIVIKYYGYIPVCYVASGFIKGSLGHYGAGRLVPRTVYTWLSEATNEYNRNQEHKKHEVPADANYFKELEKCPMGKAICWKIDHVKEKNWDKIPLKSVAEMIGRGQMPTVKDFEKQTSNI